MSPQNPTKLTMKQKQAKFLKLLLINNYNISKACESLPLDRSSFYDWLKKPAFLKKYNDLVEKSHDEIEEIIRKKAKEGDSKLLKFWAKTKMKHRGFVEKTEIEYSGLVEHRINPLEIKMAEEHVRKILNESNKTIDVKDESNT